jgi:uroporphyrin-III C-methyltransferase/precorrin-2 dehydrogenase/sirohydrochlorin ferrochelatase
MTALDDRPGVVYPAGLTLLDRRVVVVGGGRSAHRRVAGLVAARARVTVVSPEVTPAVESLAAAGAVTWLRRRYEAGDLDGSWYAVAATDDPGVNAAVAEEAERRRIFCDRIGDRSGGRAACIGVRTGRVTLVGGGPGDPGLITVRGRRAVTEADVVVADHLGPQSLLASLPPEVEIVDASKLPRGRSMAQERINALLVEHALAGKHVVRLKGGDPFVFGRGMEEFDACAAAGVPVEVVPGVTSAVSVPALAGIPVTHRSLTHEFVVVSGHLPPGHPESLVDWAAIGRLRGTVVVLMGVENAVAIAGALVEHGRAPGTPVAVVTDGSTPSQRVLRTSLAGLPTALAEDEVRPPAVWIVGDVAGLMTASSPTRSGSADALDAAGRRAACNR